MPVFTPVPILAHAEARTATLSARHRSQLVTGHRGWLLHFRGQVLAQKGFENYSQGIRQQALALFGNRQHEGLMVAEGHSPRFVDEVRNSTFCLVTVGNGWGHIEVPIILGCIPVLVMNDVLAPWENVLDVASFGLRIPRAQLPSLPDTLRSLSGWRVRELQHGLARVWERYTYSSLVVAERTRRCFVKGKSTHLSSECQRSAEDATGLTGRDAIDTLMHVLKTKLLERD